MDFNIKVYETVRKINMARYTGCPESQKPVKVKLNVLNFQLDSLQFRFICIALNNGQRHKAASHMYINSVCLGFSGSPFYAVSSVNVCGINPKPF